MHPAIRVSVESKRGCGYRSKPGALYLCSDRLGAACGKLPLGLGICPTCGNGIKPCRGWTWVDAWAIAKTIRCKARTCHPGCPLANDQGSKAGLLWIGEKFYPTVADFEHEAAQMGVSRRLAAVPKGFVVGETVVWLAHRRGIVETCIFCDGTGVFCPHPDVSDSCAECNGSGTLGRPAVFKVFQPQRIEVVVTGDEPDEEIEALLKRGLSPVKVIRDVDHQPLWDQSPN